ncbi:MAG: hypothetical protein ACI4CT_08340 [Lachnospiraceae bacterium]
MKEGKLTRKLKAYQYHHRNIAETITNLISSADSVKKTLNNKKKATNPRSDR